MSYLGLDIGTSGCKAVVFDQSGNVLASAAREYAVRSSQPGWAELDSMKVGDRSLEAIREAAGQCHSDPVEALAISSQGEAFTALDADGKVLVNAMVSSDTRAAALVRSWPAAFGSERLYEKTGHTAHPIFTLFKLQWLRENQPEIWQRINRIYCFEDYLHFRLGVKPAISHSLAARTLLFNVRETRWDAEILSAAGLRPEWLARPLEAGSVVGTLAESQSRELCLAPAARVVAGGHDQVCAALGSGAIRPGQAALGMGSVHCITAAFAEPIFDPRLYSANLCTYPHAAPGLHATLAYHLTGGNLLQWFRQEFANGPASSFEQLLAELPEAPTRLLALPYLTATGTPDFDDTTPGTLYGLRLDTRREEILRAWLEGLAFELGRNLAILESAGITIRELFATGGGARSDRWLQLLADVWNRPIHVPKVTEAGGLGAALLAGAAVSGAKIESLIGQWVQLDRTLTPDPHRAAIYTERSSAYRRLLEPLRTFSSEFSQL